MKVYKQTETKYYKYQYQDFVRPNLTANGTLGGSSFAVSGSSSATQAYYGYNGDYTTSKYLQLYSNGINTTYFYNPNPLKISTLVFTYYPKAWITSGEIYGSNDNSDYVLLTTFSHSTDVSELEINNDIPYKYFKIVVLEATANSNKIADICELDINAQEQLTVESTQDDYDYFIEGGVYLLPKINDKYYGII